MDTTNFLKKYTNYNNIELLSRINELEIKNKEISETNIKVNENIKSLCKSEQERNKSEQERIKQIKCHYDKIIKELIPGNVDYNNHYRLYETYKDCFMQMNNFIKYLNDNDYPIEVLCECEKDILQALKDTNRLCKRFNDNSAECHCLNCG